MSSLRFESPLNWPRWPEPTARGNQRSDSGFSQMTLAESINYLDEELADLNANGTLSIDIEQPLVERLKRKVGSRNGACLRLRWAGETYVLACDRWSTLEHNIYALHLVLRQLRNIERWGVGVFTQLLQGFVEENVSRDDNPSYANAFEPWMEELGLGPTSTLEDAVAVYHRRAKIAAHDESALVKLNLLMDEAREYFAGKS